MQTALTNLGVNATAAELNYNDITTLGTVEASKTVTANASGNVLFPDNEELQFGTGGDMKLYHDGSSSFIQDVGTGDINISTQSGSKVVIQGGTTGNHIAEFNFDGAAELMHNGSQKLATSSTGVDITGTAVTDGVTVDTVGH